jgi:hypothetical protein
MTQTCWCMNMNQSKIFGFGYLLENRSTLGAADVLVF